MFIAFCFFKQKTAYEMRISDWSSDVCSSDLSRRVLFAPFKKWRIDDQAVLDDFGQAGGHFSCRQGRQDIGVDLNRQRLIKSTYHVLAQGVIDGGLSTHR